MADDKNAQMFPALPEDLTALTDEELEALAAEHLQIIELAHARDEETLGARTAEEIIEQVTAGVTALEQIKGEQTARVEGEQEFVSSLDSLAKQAGLEVVAEADEPPAEDPEDPEADPDEEPADPEAVADPPAEGVEEPVAVAASAKPLRRPLPNPARHRPGANGNVDQGGLLARVASPEVGVEYGDQIGRGKLGELFAHLLNRRKLHDGVPVTVASATYDFPEDRVLEPKDPQGNSEKIQAVTGPSALVASGGLCAPLTPIYDLPGVETTARPVRDALPSFQAARGGVIIGATPLMTTYADAVGIKTNADNEAGGSLAVKNCMRIECPEFEEAVVDAIYSCIEFDNLASRAYPELMSRIDELVRAEQARLADGRLLGIIREGSVLTTGVNTGGGAIYDHLGDIAALGAGYRSRNRMPTTARLQTLQPAYLGDMLSLDSSRAAARTGEVGRAQIAAYLERFGISVTWYIDTPLDDTGAALGTTQIWAAQTAAARLDFPAETQWAIFAPGAWLHLDSGQLDLGIVRDSSLNSTNDAQQFAETWESAATTGLESDWVTSALCGNGTFGAGKDLSAICD